MIGVAAPEHHTVTIPGCSLSAASNIKSDLRRTATRRIDFLQLTVSSKGKISAVRGPKHTGNVLGSTQLLRRFVADTPNPQGSLSFSRLVDKSNPASIRCWYRDAE